MTECQAKLCISVPELAKRLGISKPIAYELVSRDDFPSLRINRRILVSIAGLEKWLEQQQKGD